MLKIKSISCNVMMNIYHLKRFKSITKVGVTISWWINEQVINNHEFIDPTFQYLHTRDKHCFQIT